MLRTAVARSASVVTRSISRQQPLIASRFASPRISFKRHAPVACFQSVRCYSAGAELNKEEVQGRILDLLKNFDKVKDSSQLSSSSHFQKDLGLDSLDTVEVVMAIEEEFSIEIPDKEADKILSVGQAVDYILAQPDGSYCKPELAI